MVYIGSITSRGHYDGIYYNDIYHHNNIFYYYDGYFNELYELSETTLGILAPYDLKQLMIFPNERIHITIPFGKNTMDILREMVLDKILDSI